MNHIFSRREFLAAAAAAGTALPGLPLLAAPKTESKPKRSPNEKLNLAVIGVANRGGANLAGVASENIVVLCDIDPKHLDSAASRFPKAIKTDDFRKVFDTKNLDGVVVSTPDHTHVFPVVQALKQKLPVYCEKPLTHSIHEVRVIADLAGKAHVPTQMGNQIHATSNYRQVVDLVQGGVIGPVRRVHVWQGGGVPGLSLPKDKNAKPPAGVNYEQWLGPVAYRPFSTQCFHFNWRYWWDFGGGQLADFICHYMDLPFWALGLKYPKTIHATGEKGHKGDNECPSKMQVDYHFEATPSQPAVHVTWYHGGGMPKGAEVYGKGSAVLFEGDEGRLIADYGTHKIFMQQGKEARKVERKTPDSIGHHKEWIEAIKGNGTPSSSFAYGALLTECGHLGNLSYRLGKKKITWDAENMKVPGMPEADKIIRREYRKGWSI